jgi:hypothetical protein
MFTVEDGGGDMEFGKSDKPKPCRRVGRKGDERAEHVIETGCDTPARVADDVAAANIEVGLNQYIARVEQPVE